MAELTDRFLINQQLMRFRIELYAAAQILSGDDLKQFKKLIKEINGLLNIKLDESVDTGSFEKPNLEDI